MGLAIFLWNFIQTRDARLLSGLLLSVVTTFVITMTLAHVGFMGRGDAEILVGISALVPEFRAPFTIFPIFALSVFTNAIFLAAPLPLFFFIRNLKELPQIRNLKELSVLFLGYRQKTSEVGWHEAVMKEGEDYRPFLNVKKAILGEKKEGEDEIWVTPALPFVLFLFAGFLISIAYGDIAASILSLI